MRWNTFDLQFVCFFVLKIFFEKIFLFPLLQTFINKHLLNHNRKETKQQNISTIKIKRKRNFIIPQQQSELTLSKYTHKQKQFHPIKLINKLFGPETKKKEQKGSIKHHHHPQ
jgi:hypothetical protein